jgi:O-antigen ligase
LVCWSALLIYIGAQAIPIPPALIKALSPARSSLSTAMTSVVGPDLLIPLSISTTQTVEYLGRFAGYFLIFLLAHELALLVGETRQWLFILGVVLVGIFEAAIGIAQFVLSGNSTPATGTYVNRNHLGGLLGMILPIALGQATISLRYAADRASPFMSIERTARICVWCSVCGILLGGILCTSSRMSAIACVIAATATLCLVYRPSLPKLTSIAICVLLAMAFLLPAVFVDRFALLAIDDGRDAHTRLDLWRDSISIVKAFPLFGSGAGTYSTALLQYKTVAPSHNVNFAHNDYLQHLCELGIIGIVPLAVLATFVFLKTFFATTRAETREQRALGAGLTGAMLSMIVHSAVDFNLYIPANAAVLAWIAGSSLALPYLTDSVRRPQARRRGWIRVTPFGRAVASGAHSNGHPVSN